MTLKLDDVAIFEELEGQFGLGRRGGRRAPYAPTRRDVLRGAALGVTAWAVHAFGLLPTSRPAFANDDPPGGWTESMDGTDFCDNLGSWVDDDNCTGCNNKLIASILCAADNYHKGDAHGCSYKHRPDVCRSGGYDSWDWLYGPCCPNGSRNQRWRCSDGWYRDNCNWSYAESICRFRKSSQVCT